MKPLSRVLLFSCALMLVLGAAGLLAGPAHAADLLYADEFGGPLDGSTWRQLTPWYSHRTTGELQYYAESNVSFSGGVMDILAKRDTSYTGYAYSSGIVTSLNRPKFTYGYFETRALLPTGKGVWPAFWLTNDSTLEIDIMEFLGEDPRRMYMTYHRSGNQVFQNYFDDTDFTTQYHTFAVDWQPTYIRWYVDDTLRAEYKGTIPSDPMWIIYNTALGGAWAVDPDDTTPLPQHYLVDYLRVYNQKPAAPSAPVEPTAPTTPTEPSTPTEPTEPSTPTEPTVPTTPTEPTVPATDLVTVYRFYNVKNGTHFYTASAAERDMVITTWPGSYKYEGVAYTLKPSANPYPLYRFYNSRLGAHFYTASTEERDWVIKSLSKTHTYEGSNYSVALSPDAGPAVYRFYNKRNGAHFYTASIEERDAVIANHSKTYAYEGPTFYLGQ